MDRFSVILTDFHRLQGGTDLRILGPILASAEISEEIAIFVQILAILCRFSEIFASGGTETLLHPTLDTCTIKLLEASCDLTCNFDTKYMSQSTTNEKLPVLRSSYVSFSMNS